MLVGQDHGQVTCENEILVVFRVLDSMLLAESILVGTVLIEIKPTSTIQICKWRSGHTLEDPALVAR